MKRVWHKINGRVLTDGSTPAPEAIIEVVRGSVPLPELAQRTEQDGTFRMALPKGEFVLGAYAEGGAGW